MGFALRRDQGFPIALDLRIKYFSIRIMLSLINKGKKGICEEIYLFSILCGFFRVKEDGSMALTPKDIASMLDHSTLQPWLTEDDIRRGCEVALKYQTASVCARPCDVPILKEMLAGSPVKVCTVIGFPHGAHQTAVKVAEAKQALAEGCEELDMVLNIGKLKHGDADYVENEIRQLAETAHAAGAILKVILETCYLTEEEKILACKISEKAGADFVKTSTGYGSAGCTIEDLKLMRANVSEAVRIKGSGGIRDLDTVLSARAVGASRCGVSATEKIMAEAEKRYAEGTLKEIDTLKEMGGGY